MKTLKHKFIDKIPQTVEEGVIYISIPYETVIHMCCCGCGNEVVTPISPTDWILIFDGETISLNPSIGNWSLDCRSHYFIKKNRVVWSYKYSFKEIKDVRKKDINDKLYYFNDHKMVKHERITEKSSKFFDRFRHFFNKNKSN